MTDETDKATHEIAALRAVSEEARRDALWIKSGDVYFTPDEFDAEVMEELEVAEMPVVCDPVEELHDATTRLRAEQGRIEAILRKLTGSTIISPETPRV